MVLVPFIISLILFGAGLLSITGGCPGQGLVLLGIGCIVGGFGGSLEVGYGAAVVGGTGGFVLIIVGVALPQLVTGC